MDKNKTIEEGKIYLRENLKKGAVCPCCNQFVKIYKRKLSVVMVRSLIRLYELNKKMGGSNYFHSGDIVRGISSTGTHDLSKLRYWGLIKQKEKSSSKKRTSGYWEITPIGEAFVRSKIQLPEYILVYNKRFMGYDGEQVDIKDVVEGFDYLKLMSDERA